MGQQLKKRIKRVRRLRYKKALKVRVKAARKQA